MTRAALIVIALMLASCGKKQLNIHDDADTRLSRLKSPVILIGKYKSMGNWSSVVRDSTGKIESFGNLTILGQSLGESRNIGDTIK